jgi:Ca-activated chloride channel family protein
MSGADHREASRRAGSHPGSGPSGPGEMLGPSAGFTRLVPLIGLPLAILLLPGAAWIGAPLRAQATSPQQPSFRVGVDVVSLNVTVTGADGRYVTDLDTEDFSVFEDGVKQDVRYFNRSNIPLALSLLIDSSASMEEKISTAQDAAIGFARRVRPQDLAELIDFDTRVTVTQIFTSSPEELEQAIRKTTAGGSTALYNAVYISLKELKKIQAKSQEDVRRQAIIVLSDGEDTSSLVSFEEVLDLAKRSETAIYTIGLRSRDDVTSKGFKEADFVLRELAQQTGGRSFFSTHVEQLAGVYGQISDELSSQYLIGYVSKNTRRDGAWRRVVVRVSRPNANARTKLGYYAPGLH